ncbi:protein phosphatase 1 regulatory subunit 14B isoform X2 [Eurytemora carolleeae]|nr:protein phosphatase 1 regulatory subunit 14B isoform X2 [Eurytemora carolleeae]XP_023329250.1 protein phosphatase 1 regulatory subunit 14B isoform X2 [Eurytemora carolleeae]|eukprot:XP_023329248.1 protein phosphatase 1 regulatory subunit 14B-like isoform X2 [Eurytemora affinis]
MEVGLPPPKGYAPVGVAPKAYSTQGQKNGYAPSSRPADPATPNKTVNFGLPAENEKKREKFLTAKYGAHQMALIRKRLRVEMWMYDQLQSLYTEEEGLHDIEIDLDEVLDMEDDKIRKTYLQELLTDSTRPIDLVNKFVDDLLEKTKTL